MKGPRELTGESVDIFCARSLVASAQFSDKFVACGEDDDAEEGEEEG